MNAARETWLRCRVSPGMFDHELGVQGQQANGAEYALFAPREAVDCRGQELKSDATIPGLVLVKVVERRNDLVCVQLPGETFQNGSFISVTADQLVSGPQQVVSGA
jgi:hypothetical protein